MTQKDLATLVNIHATDLQKIENGTQVADQQSLGRLERALGVKLRGTDIGSPLRLGPKKK